LAWHPLEKCQRPQNARSWFAAIFTTAADGWAVGGSDGRVAIARWDGRRWTGVPGADLGDRRASFADVAALNSADAWAVGSMSIGPAHTGVLVEHWDGARWSVIPTPDVGQSQLAAVAAISRANVWAVGNQVDNTLIEHWDSDRWEVIPNPAAPVGRLEDIAAVSARDIWTVGTGGAWPGRQTPLIEHWDGTWWRVVAAPARRTDPSAAWTSSLRVTSGSPVVISAAVRRSCIGEGPGGPPSRLLKSKAYSTWRSPRQVETTFGALRVSRTSRTPDRESCTTAATRDRDGSSVASIAAEWRRRESNPCNVSAARIACS
jgi:hypothetical protein